MSETTTATIKFRGEEHAVRKITLPVLLKASKFLDELSAVAVDLFQRPDPAAHTGYKETITETPEGFQKETETPGVSSDELAKANKSVKDALSRAVGLVSTEDNLRVFLTVVAGCIPTLVKVDDSEKWDRGLPSDKAVDALMSDLTVDELLPLAFAVLEAATGKSVRGAVEATMGSLAHSATSQATSDSELSSSEA